MKKTTMKKPKTTRRLLLLTAMAATAASPQGLLANDLYWDPDADAAIATGGVGIWNLTSSLWRGDSSDGPLQTYDNTNPSSATAHFGGTAGTVTLDAGATINSNMLAFEVDGYTLAGGAGSALNFSGDFPLLAGTGTTTISAKITGTSGFTQSGGSFTILSGDLTGLFGTVEVATRLNLNGATVTGSQNQAYNVTGILSSENHVTTSTVQLGYLSGSGTLRIGNNGTGTIDSGTDTFQIGARNTDPEFSGTITNHAAALTAIKKVGTGALTLSGANSYTGATTVNAGTLTLSGAGTSGAINLAGTATTLNFSSAGTVTVPSLTQGFAATDGGIVNQAAGTLTTTEDIALGNFGSYGAYRISGGTLNVRGFRAGSITGGGNGSGYILQTGGTVNVSLITTLNRSGTGTSVLNIAGDSAVYNQDNNNLNLGYAPGGTGIVTVGAGSLVVNTSIVFGNGGSNGILNLNGGSTSTNDINVLAAVGNFGVVNLNGGLLKANVDKATFMQGLTAANVCSDGARIDTNGKTINIDQPLLGTLGTTGVSAIPLAAGGSGYLAAPVVAISGGDGTGASAVANVAGGVVTSITITSAGTGYTSPPTVTLTGGGAATPATLGTVAIGANATDGGLTKTGAGILKLSGDNTYTGPTVVNGGTLQAGTGGDAFGANSAVALADADGAALDLADWNVVIGSLSGGGSTGGNVTLGYGILTVGNNSITPASFAGSISGNGGLTKTGSGTQILSGNNAYAGDTSIDQGTLQLAAGGRLGFVVTDSFSNQIYGLGALVLNGS
ncbi:MAG: uncharacterized protein JWO82_1834, partial [Akkermansiaceae bacterium]|nr:uncharacterized protein [Akkermansiaceae bacterium]